MSLELGAAALITGAGAFFGGQSAAKEREAGEKKAQQKFDEAIGRATEQITQRETAAIGDVTGFGERAAGQFSPFTGAGQDAVESLKAALGLPSEGEFAPTVSPAFQFRTKIESEALNKQLAALGQQGNITARRRLISQIGAEETESQIRRLQNLATLGLSGATGAANVLTGTGANIANIRTGAGQSLGNLITARGQAAAQTQRRIGEQRASIPELGANIGLNLFQFQQSQDLIGKLGTQQQLPTQQLGQVNNPQLPQFGSSFTNRGRF